MQYGMKKTGIILITVLFLCTTEMSAQLNVYRSGGGELILSGADVSFIAPTNHTDVNTNARFTLFFHTQQLLNIDLTGNLGIYTGAAIRNVGLIMEDRYQYLGFSDVSPEMMDKNAKVKRRSYSLGFPLAVKLGAINKDFFFYAGGEYEWMFHYKQKLFIDDTKTKQKEWGSARVTPWNPSLFAGVQFPGGFNLKFKYYMNDFLNHDYVGEDFGRPVDYSQFESSGIWYVSLAVIINRKQIERMLESQQLPNQSASRF